jgi:hypothetical protein
LEDLIHIRGRMTVREGQRSKHHSRCRRSIRNRWVAYLTIGMAMDIGIGLDATLNLSFADQAALSQEAARLDYTSIWTPESTGQDAFQLCSQRWVASCQVIPEGLTTGIGVSP